MHTRVRYTSVHSQLGLSGNHAACIGSFSAHHLGGLLSEARTFMLMLLMIGIVMVAAVLIPQASTRFIQKMAGGSPQMEFLAGIYSADASAMRCALESGASLDAADALGTTPLMIASHYEDPGPAEFLLNRGARPDRADVNGMTALMFAARADRPQIARRLLAAGADPHLRNDAGRDALTIARGWGSWRVVQVLEERAVGAERR